MSDAPQGPGWWQASDGRWYPPAASAVATSPYAEDFLPSGPPPGAPTTTSGKATATLVLGILSFFTCPILAVIALVLGSQADREIRDSYGRLGGEGQVKVGRVLAIVDLALIVPLVLAAIAIPTFLGARERAQDRLTQAELRNVLTAEKVISTDTNAWSDDPAQLAAVEPTLRYEQGTVPSQEHVVYVVVRDGALGLSSRGRSGTCFYVFAPSVTTANYGYAKDRSCRGIEAQDFRTRWE